MKGQPKIQWVYDEGWHMWGLYRDGSWRYQGKFSETSLPKDMR